MKDEDVKDPIETNEDEGAETTPEENIPEDKPEPEPKAEPEKPKAEEDKKTPWFQTRINELVGQRESEKQKRERAEAQAAQAIAELAEARKQKPAESPEKSAEKPPEKNLTAEEIEKLAEKKAVQIAHDKLFNDACNATYASGVKEFGDFDASLRNFQMLGGLSKDFLEIVTEIPDGHKLIHQLGKDPDEAARVLALPPKKMALELARMEANLEKKKSVSNVPDPVKPISGKGKAEADPEKMSPSEWMEWRNKQLAKKRG